MDSVTLEQRDEHPHMLVYDLRGVYYYETKSVKSGRKVKTCTACGRSIQEGEQSFSLKFYGWDGEYPDNWVCYPCKHEDPKTMALIEEICAGKWNLEH